MTTRSQTPGRDAMRRLFDELAARGTRILETQAVRRALASELRRAWWILPAVPLTILLLQGFHQLQDLILHIIRSQHPLKVIRRDSGHLFEGLSPVLSAAESKSVSLGLEPLIQFCPEGAGLIAIGV